LYPEKYDGTTALALFLNNVESCATYNDWTESDKLAHVRKRLVGTAIHVLSGGISSIPTYSDLVEKLEKCFGTKDQSTKYRSQLKCRRRLKGESLQLIVYDDVSRLILLAYPGEKSAHRDDFVVEAFIEALDDYNLELYVHSQNPKYLKAALNHASIIESFTSTRAKRSDPDQSNSNDKSERQPVDKYGGRVRSVTGDGEIPVIEAFVRQVVERIQGVIEAKFTPAQPLPITTTSSAYSGLSYRSSPFQTGNYTTVSPPQVVYVNPTVSQPSNLSAWINSAVARPQRVPNPDRKYCTCGSPQHLSSACPGKTINVGASNNTTNTSDSVNTSSSIPGNNSNTNNSD